jgi:hypothetical protein
MTFSSVRFVKRANLWVVTYFGEPNAKDSRGKQHQNWFSTENDARAFADSLIEQDKKK